MVQGPRVELGSPDFQSGAEMTALAHLADLGYPMRIELMIAESQPAVLPLNYGHH